MEEDDELTKLIEVMVDEKEEIKQVKEFIRTNDLEGLVRSKILKETQAKKLWKHIKEREEKMGKIYFRYPMEEGKYKANRGIIMGGCGNGKTSLMNKICQTAYPAGEGLHSKTRNILCARVSFLGSKKFRVFDTAGTTSQQELSKHAALLYHTLIHRPINVIFVSIKYDSRGINMILEMEAQTSIVQEYSVRVVFLVSHFDLSKEPEKLIGLIYEEMGKRMLKQQVIFYSNKYSDPALLARYVYLTATNHPEVKLEIPKKVFEERFMIGRSVEQFKNKAEDNCKQAKRLCDAYIKCARDLPADEERELIVQELALDLKYRLQERLDGFVESAKDLMLNFEYYDLYYAFQAEILYAEENFQDATIPFLRYTLVHESEGNQEESIYDLIKQCPSCKQIWFRVQSCPNTTCGNRPSSFWDYSVGRSYFTYRFEWVDGELRVIKKERLKKASKEIKIDQRLEGQVNKCKRQKGKWELEAQEHQIIDQIRRLSQARQALKTELKESVTKPLKKNEFQGKDIDWNQLNRSIQTIVRKLIELEKTSDRTKPNFKFSSAITDKQMDQLSSKLKILWKQQQFRRLKPDIQELHELLGKAKTLARDSALSASQRIVDAAFAQSEESIWSRLVKIARGALSSKHLEISVFLEYRWALRVFKRQSQKETLEQSILKVLHIFEKIHSQDLAVYTDAELEKQVCSLFTQGIELKVQVRDQLIRLQKVSGSDTESLEAVAHSLRGRSVQQELMDCRISNIQQELPNCEEKLVQTRKQLQEVSKTTIVGCGHPMNFQKLPRIPNIEQLLQEFYTPTDLKMEEQKIRTKEEARIDQERLNKFVQEELIKFEETDKSTIGSG